MPHCFLIFAALFVLKSSLPGRLHKQCQRDQRHEQKDNAAYCIGGVKKDIAAKPEQQDAQHQNGRGKLRD